MSWYWREVDTKDSAYDATRAAVGVSFFIAAVTTLIAILAIVNRKPILGLNAWSLTDGALFCIIGWRISRLSKAWTIVGLCLYLFEAVSSIGQRGIGVGVLTIIFIIAYINAVRGVFAYHRLAKTETTEQPLPGPDPVS